MSPSPGLPGRALKAPLQRVLQAAGVLLGMEEGQLGPPP